MLELSVFLALVIYFLHVTTREGQIFHGVNRLAFNWPPWVKKPLFGCPICMSPWYGAGILFLGGFPVTGDLFRTALVLAAMGGLNAILVYFEPKEPEYEDE